MARREPRVQSIKREKKSHLGEISPKIIFFGNVRERDRGGKNPLVIGIDTPSGEKPGILG